MITFGDPFDTLFNLQRALEGRLESDWLQDQTTSQGPFPPINVFQQGDDILAIIELPGVEKDSLQIQAKENTIRIAGKKVITYPEEVSIHRRERTFGEFDRTLSLPGVRQNGIACAGDSAACVTIGVSHCAEFPFPINCARMSC